MKYNNAMQKFILALVIKNVIITNSIMKHSSSLYIIVQQSLAKVFETLGQNQHRSLTRLIRDFVKVFDFHKSIANFGRTFHFHAGETSCDVHIRRVNLYLYQRILTVLDFHAASNCVA